VREHYEALAETYDRKANAACKRAYLDLVRRCFGDAPRVLEIGAGSSSLAAALPARLRSTCDLSVAMLRTREPASHVLPVVGDARFLPYRDESFDGVFCVNLLEHVPDPGRVLREMARVSAPGARCLAVTPNGDREALLELLERLRLKLPEGPHRFLRFAELRDLAREHFRVLEHRAFLSLPVGPRWLVAATDRLLGASAGRGLFQLIALSKAGS
jgi:ubiquinone/menaquinone biosynthesis C-methylase UbiE